MVKVASGVLLAVFLIGGTALAQPDGHSSSDATKCSKCKPALDKAVSYVKKNLGRSGLPGHIFAGLMYMVMEDYGADFSRCVGFAKNSINHGGFNRNWWLAMCTYFLSEAYVRRPTGEIGNALTGSFKTAQKEQEKTGGWCHNLGMAAETGYVGKGGGEDIALLTSMIYSGYWSIQAAGLTPPKGLFEKAEENLENVKDGFGFKYGTGSGWHDLCSSRAGYVLLGLLNAGQTDHKFYEMCVKGLHKRYTLLEKGHAFAPFHYFAVAAAMARLGEYDKFAEHWIDELISEQKADGTIKLKHDDDKRSYRNANQTANAAVLAIILLLQDPDRFKLPEKKAPKAKFKKGGGGSPFGRKDDGKIETGEKASKPEPAPRPKKKKSPFGRD